MFTALVYRFNLNLSWLPALLFALLLGGGMAFALCLTAAYAPVVLAAAGAVVGKLVAGAAGTWLFAFVFMP